MTRKCNGLVSFCINTHLKETTSLHKLCSLFEIPSLVVHFVATSYIIVEKFAFSRCKNKEGPLETRVKKDRKSCPSDKISSKKEQPANSACLRPKKPLFSHFQTETTPRRAKIALNRLPLDFFPPGWQKGTRERMGGTVGSDRFSPGCPGNRRN